MKTIIFILLVVGLFISCELPSENNFPKIFRKQKQLSIKEITIAFYGKQINIHTIKNVEIGGIPYFIPTFLKANNFSSKKMENVSLNIFSISKNDIIADSLKNIPITDSISWNFNSWQGLMLPKNYRTITSIGSTDSFSIAWDILLEKYPDKYYFANPIFILNWIEYQN